MTNVPAQQEVDYLYKSLNGQFNVDEAQGIVEAFVAGIGNKDSVGDICLPGCFGGSLKRRKPRVVWGHDWNSPIGKVLEIYEVGPNDPRLPSKMRKAGIGGLYAKVQFNLKAEKGRQSDHQKAVAARFDRVGGVYLIARSLDEVEILLRAAGVPVHAKARGGF